MSKGGCERSITKSIFTAFLCVCVCIHAGCGVFIWLLCFCFCEWNSRNFPPKIKKNNPLSTIKKDKLFSRAFFIHFIFVIIDKWKAIYFVYHHRQTNTSQSHNKNSSRKISLLFKDNKKKKKHKICNIE